MNILELIDFLIAQGYSEEQAGLYADEIFGLNKGGFTNEKY